MGSLEATATLRYNLKSNKQRYDYKNCDVTDTSCQRSNG